MSYGDLYIGRKAPTTAAPAPIPQPINQSAIDHYRALNKTSQDASGEGYTQAERQSAREIQQLMSEGRFGIGQIIPHRLMPLVFNYAIPEHMKEMQANTGSIVGRLAQKIDASLATDGDVTRRGLSTDHQPGRGRNDLAPHTHQLQRPVMSYRLSQVMGDTTGTMPEAMFDSEMIRCGVQDVREKIALKTEAIALGLMRPRGSQQAVTYVPGMLSDDQEPDEDDPMEIIQHSDGTTSLHLRGKIDPEMLKKMRSMLKPTKKPAAKAPDGKGLKLHGTGRTMQASADGYAPENTSIWLHDSGLERV